MSLNVNNIGFKQAEALLRDCIFLLDFDPNSPEGLKLYKLLQARHNNPDFELDLALFICGEEENHFPYRSSSYLTQFYKDLGYNYVHDGSTRKYWVRDTLLQMTIQEISHVIEKGLFNKRDFKRLGTKTNPDYEKDYREAIQEFKKFINESLSLNEGVDLNYLLDLNINTELLFEKSADTEDEELNKLIEEAKNRFFHPRDKQIAVEKLWDAFERLKTYFNANKKNSVSKLVKVTSRNFDEEIINQEFEKLTDIGNKFRIRHHETDKKKITEPKHLNYLFFRMLSLINLCLTSLKDMDHVV
jgi:hypothetical protein